ncbi:MAG: CPBP family intramembrane glutamic endopeptidase [Bacteroidales bacterium]|jgi:membrane protease YdiL (CAAX protease family)
MSQLLYSIHLGVFLLVVTLMAVIYPVTGYRQNKNQEKYFKGNRYNKTSWYRKSMVWSWIPTLLVLAAMLFAGTDPSDLGFRMPSAQINDIKPVLFYMSVSAAALYTLYMLFSIISIRFSKKIREHHASQIPPGLKHILPVTKQEKKTWILLSFTAGFTEEFLYRGYLFFAIALIFGFSHPAILIPASTLLFAAGHIYQGKEAIKPTFAGLLLALLFYFTGSLYIVIFLHFLQDMIAGELLE